MENPNNSSDLESRLSGVTAVGDLHHNLSPLKDAFEYSRERNNKILYNGDWVGDYNLIELGSSMGYRLGAEILDEFMVENLSEQDYQTYAVLQEMTNVGGFENYLALIGQQNNLDSNAMQAVTQNLTQLLQYAGNELFQKRMSNIEERFHSEKQEELIDNQLKYNALFEVILQEQGLDFASILNEYSDVEVLFNNGNHDTREYIDTYVRPHLENKEQVIVLNDQVGYVEANGLNIVGSTNSYQRIIGSVRMAISPEMIAYHYSHVDSGIDKAVLITEEKTKADIESLESIIQNDAEFKRMTNNGKDLESKTLHINATHAPIAGNQAYSATAAYLSLFAGINVASDTHKSKEGETPFGNKMINTGTKMTDIYLDENGEVQYDMIDFAGDYDSFIGYVNPDMAYLQQRTEEIYQIMKQRYKEAMNSQSEGFANAA